MTRFKVSVILKFYWRNECILGLIGNSQGNLFPTGNMIEIANLLQEFSPDAVYEDRVLDHQAEKREYTKKGMKDYMTFYKYYKSELPNFIK